MYAQSDYSQNQPNQLIHAPYDKNALYPVNKKKKIKIGFFLSEEICPTEIMENVTSEFNQSCKDSKSTFETATDQQDQQKSAKNSESCLDIAGYQEPEEDVK